MQEEKNSRARMVKKMQDEHNQLVKQVMADVEAKKAGLAPSSLHLCCSGFFFTAFQFHGWNFAGLCSSF